MFKRATRKAPAGKSSSRQPTTLHAQSVSTTKAKMVKRRSPDVAHPPIPTTRPLPIFTTTTSRFSAQPPQQKAKKTNSGPSNRSQKKKEKDFLTTYTAAFPNHTLEYVDTHVHLDAILSRLNLGEVQKRARLEGSLPVAGAASGCGGDDSCQPAESPSSDAAILAQLAPADQWTVERLHKEAHVGQFGGAVTVCCEASTFEPVMKILNEDQTGKIFGAFGIHPHEASKWNDQIEAMMEKAMSHPKVVAWGEIGLDYHYLFSPKEDQERVFIRQIELGVKHRKPLVIHTREAEEDTVRIMLKHVPKDHFVHLHCCTSSTQLTAPLLEHFTNLYIGFTGCITFKNNDTIIETLSSMFPPLYCDVC